MQRLRWAVVGVITAAAFTGQAQAATTIGQTFEPTEHCSSIDFTWLQTSSTNSAYAAPHAGVITSWSHQAGIHEGELRLKVGRGSGSNLSIVGQSELEPLDTMELNTFPTRIPVEAGDVIGFYFPHSSIHCLDERVGFDYHYASGDVLPGAAATWTPSMAEQQLDVSAQLEPDADRDGFGDETQDGCPSDASTTGSCPEDTTAPETTITKDAPKRTDTGNVKFRFESNETGSSFECKLKGKDLKRTIKQFNDCASPRKYKKLDDGRYRFKVRATDAAGNVDATPAKARFKVVD